MDATKGLLRTIALGSVISLTVASGHALAQAAPTDPKDKTVKGSGAAGNLTVWTAPDTLGNSVLVERNGNIGLGTTAPGSKLTVIGRIEADASGPGASLLGQSETGSAVRGASPSGPGVFGSSQTGVGVYGNSESHISVLGSSLNGTGVQGQSASSAHWGVRGDNTAAGGIGIFGQALNGTAVKGISNTGFGLFAQSQTNVGVYAKASGHDAVVGESGAAGRSGVFGFNTNSQGFGVFGNNAVHATFGFLGGDVGASGFSAAGVGVRGSTTTGVAGLFQGPVEIYHGNAAHAITADGAIYSVNGGFRFPDGSLQTTAASNVSVAHTGQLTGDGTFGKPLGVAVPLVLVGNVSGGGATIAAQNLNTSNGSGIAGSGVIGVAGSGAELGVLGAVTDPSGTAIEGYNPGGQAGLFVGDVAVNGTLTKSGGSFKIDHPLDPANKYLSHSFVESPDMMNIYNGIAQLDASGQAIIALPEWFEALNGQFRYQLTAIGAPAPSLYIAREVEGNQFTIAGGGPFLKVSWEVTGIRRDAWAMKHRIAVEEEKPETARGQFLHPELYRKPR